MDRLHDLRRQLAPLGQALLEHPIYRHISSLPALHLFMEHHVFAVWDFMSLLKELQRRLCCVTVPWLPSGNSLGSRLVNEIVLGEESDEDGAGGFTSHFELYHRAMASCGASTVAIDGFLTSLGCGSPVAAALETARVAPSVRGFVRQTFAYIADDNRPALAAAFTFGREDLLPALFRRVVDELNQQTNGGLELFRYYLNRHIGLDEREHGPLADKLIILLCGEDEARWHSAAQAAVRALEARLSLWNGMLEAIVRVQDGVI